MAYLFKIKLLNVKKPPVWRRVIIPENCTFEEFHHTIQISFGWDNEHLHKFSDKPYGGCFEISSRCYDDDMLSNVDSNMYRKSLDEQETKLCDVFGTDRQKLLYVYDFGDD